MNIKCIYALVMMLLIGCSSAAAEAVQSTTTVYVSFRQCISGKTVCDAIGPTQFVSVGGLPGSPQAQARLDDPAYGVAVGTTKHTGVPGATSLTAEVTSMPATRNGSTNGSVQLYTNTSDTPQKLSFEGTVTYDQTVPAENAGFPAEGGGSSGTFAEMELFTMNTTTIEAGTTAEENFAALSKAPPSESGYQMLKSSSTHGIISGMTESDTKTLTMIVELKPGNSIWMYAGIQTIAANGAKVTASLETNLKIITE